MWFVGSMLIFQGVSSCQIHKPLFVREDFLPSKTRRQELVNINWGPLQWRLGRPWAKLEDSWVSKLWPKNTHEIWRIDIQNKRPWKKLYLLSTIVSFWVSSCWISIRSRFLFEGWASTILRSTKNMPSRKGPYSNWRSHGSCGRFPLESYWNLWGFQMFVVHIKLTRWLWQEKRTFMGLYIYIVFEKDPCHDGHHHDNDCHLYSGVILAAIIIIIIIIIVIIIVIIAPSSPWLHLYIDFHAMVYFEEQQQYKQHKPMDPSTS